MYWTCKLAHKISALGGNKALLPSALKTLYAPNVRSKATNSSSPQDDLDQPISWSKSGIHKGPSSQFRNKDDSPWYQPLSISISIGAILIWFCILREENDIDKNIGKSLYERVDGLEKKQIEIYLNANLAKTAAETESLHKRLAELKVQEGK